LILRKGLTNFEEKDGIIVIHFDLPPLLHARGTFVKEGAGYVECFRVIFRVIISLLALVTYLAWGRG